ncbi:MAG: squalene synthase HpnC [Ottowia sp.]|nr:squalene synthase HpnC [Ottowia sp.]
MPTFTSVSHAENFPVASLFIAPKLRAPIAAIYCFARNADDFADEGDHCAETRLTALAEYHQGLDRIAQGLPANTPLFEALNQVIRIHQLALAPFYDLLHAFRRDIFVKRYRDNAALLNYCRYSANPIGQLILALHGLANEQTVQWSNAICTGLQLANFCQDVALDWRMGRIYLPQDELYAAGITPDNLPQAELSAAWRTLMNQQITRARTLLHTGRPLVFALKAIGKNAIQKDYLAKRLSWELRLTIEGGLRILERIEQCHYRVFTQRPTLNFRDWLIIIARCFRFKHSSSIV